LPWTPVRPTSHILFCVHIIKLMLCESLTKCRWWQHCYSACRMNSVGGIRILEGPHVFFLNRALLYRLNPALLVQQLECGPMPNVMAALPNIGGPCVQRRKVWLTPTTRVPCSNAAKTQNPLKFAGVPQTYQQISAVSRPKFTILWGHVEEVSMFNKFVFRLSIHALAAKI